MSVSQIANEIVSRIKTGEPFTVTNKARMKLWIEEALLSVHDEAIEKCAKKSSEFHLSGAITNAIRTLKLKKEA